MNRLSTEQRVRVISALVEGNGLRATARMTVEKLLRDLGAACVAHHDAAVRNLTSKRIQCDEIWAFVGSKQKNVPDEKRGQWGDIWTWTALDPDSKLIVSYRVSNRTAADAYDFMQDVAARLTRRVQLTTDQYRVYLNAVDYAFGTEIDYAILEKHYGSFVTSGSAAHRYTPARITAAKRVTVSGDPNPRHISTSHVERQNLTMRMHMRRFTRLTNGFSKKTEMHAHAVALHFGYYNWCKIHQTLRVTPAMEAGLSDHVWSIQELICLLDRP
jgi:IS1 family transposase